MEQHEPTCRVCHLAIEPGDLVNVAPAGGIAHLRCAIRKPGARATVRRGADPTCPACGVTMAAGDHVVKIGHDVVHARCYDDVVRRMRPSTGT